MPVGSRQPRLSLHQTLARPDGSDYVEIAFGGSNPKLLVSVEQHERDFAAIESSDARLRDPVENDLRAHVATQREMAVWPIPLVQVLL